MFELHLRFTLNEVVFSDYTALANQAKSHISIHISAVVHEAKMQPLRTVMSATHLRPLIEKVGDRQMDPFTFQATLMQWRSHGPILSKWAPRSRLSGHQCRRVARFTMIGPDTQGHQEGAKNSRMIEHRIYLLCGFVLTRLLFTQERITIRHSASIRCIVFKLSRNHTATCQMYTRSIDLHNVLSHRSSTRGTCQTLYATSMPEPSKPEKAVPVVGTIVQDKDFSVRQADDLKLAELGYKSQFKREFSLMETASFAFSIMALVASISATLEFGLVSGGHVGLVFGWLIPCIFVMFVALSMAELASSMPTSAGLYFFSAKLAPSKYAPLASWITGWANITGQVALVCSIDFNCAQMIASAISVASDGATNLSSGATYGMLLAILFSHGVLCSAATSIIAKLNIFYVLLNVGTFMAAIIAMLVLSEDKVSAKDAFFLFENNSGWSNDGWAFMLAFTTPMWILTGYDSAVHISEEITGASRAVPIAILVGVGATAILGWVLLIATSFVIPSMTKLLGTNLPLPMAQVFLDTLGKRGMLAIWACIILVQYSSGVAQGVDASRAVFAFARDNALPGSRWWKVINPRTRTPVNAVWLVMAATAICGFLGFSQAALTSLAGASVIGLYTSYAAPIFLRITYGRDKLVPGPFTLGAWSTPVGAIAIAWISFIIVLLFFPPGQRTTTQDMNYTVVIIMGVFIFATASWVFSAHKWFKGPVRNIDDGAEDKASYDEEKR
ncbi:hypothetical protein D9615_007229 [Tricholomella constricta]|uniref:Amino acid transporter n=1 Tax=Tricholomella constricta TaxID=117010 RepID=A0A8H5M178_9AGAR|nr:hypothetical protein D9615_007229 [Tricholomella constricta]